MLEAGRQSPVQPCVEEPTNERQPIRRCLMSLTVRRVIAGNNQEGRCVVVANEVIDAVSRGMGAGITGSEIWSTDQMPVDNAVTADSSQRAGFVKHFNEFNWVGTGGGTTFRVTEWAPGHAKFTHRTQTVDYDIVLAGEIDLELDGGEVVHLKTGDVVIMRGGTHTWHNKGAVPAITAFVLVDALPVSAKGKLLEPLFPADPGSTF
jgi:uncharacterized cupin superfamily protein